MPRRNFKTPTLGLGWHQLDLLDSIDKGASTVPLMVEDTGRERSLVYGTLRALRRRKMVKQLVPRRALRSGRGTSPARWSLTKLGQKVLVAARALEARR